MKANQFSMKPQHQLPYLNPEKPYEQDKFDRAEHGYVLSKLINLQDGDMVVGLNGSWGIGKTTFLEMWQQQLILDGHQVAYFNAWSDDYSTDPLPALLATFKDLSKSEGKDEIWNEVLKAGSAFAKNTLPTLLGFLLHKQTGIANINDLVKAIGEGGVDYLTTEVNEFEKRKKLMVRLKERLTEYISLNGSGKKSVIIIDELDRCRPHYAVSVLELVKHLFAIKNVVFVLAIDKEQLKHAICGVYGSSNLDANAYLQRFINVEYHLPAPDSATIARYFTDYFIIERDGYTVGNEGIKRINWDPTSFIEFVALFQEDKQLSIRNLEKIFVTTRLAIDALNYYPRRVFELIFFLAYLMHHHSQTIMTTSLKTLSADKVLKLFQTHLPEADLDNDLDFNQLTFLEASIVVLHNNEAFKGNRIDLNKESTYVAKSGNEVWIGSKYESEPNQLRINIKSMLEFSKEAKDIKLSKLINAVRQFKGLASV